MTRLQRFAWRLRQPMTWFLIGVLALSVLVWWYQELISLLLGHRLPYLISMVLSLFGISAVLLGMMPNPPEGKRD